MENVEDVVVIAGDASFRRSLVFLFEAEGLKVTPLEIMPSPGDASISRHRCAVIDDGSIDGPDTWERLAALADATVLLLGRPMEAPVGVEFVIDKPLLGMALVEAVMSALLRSPARSLS